MTERDELRERIQSSDEVLLSLRTIEAPTPGAIAALRSLQLQRDDFVEQMETLGRTAVTLRFEGEGVREHEMNADALGRVLLNLQQAITAVGQALRIQATRVGPVARSMIGATQLNFVGSFNGSVGIELRGSTDSQDAPIAMDLDSLLDDSTRKVMEAFQLATSPDIDDDPIIEAVLPLGSRAYKHLTALSKALQDERLDVAIQLRTESGTRADLAVSYAHARRLYEALNRQVLTEETETIQGHLGTVSDIRTRIELVTDDGVIVTAHVEEDLLPRLGEFYSRQVRAELEILVTTERATEIKRFHRVVRHLELIDGSDPDEGALLPA